MVLILTHPAIITISGFLLFIEFFADKIPWVDSLWDGVHTFIRIPAGAVLAASVMGGEGATMQLAMVLLGGTIAAGTHLAKITTRAAINTSPEPFTNIVSSFTEEAFFASGMWLLLNQPSIFIVCLILFMVVAIVVVVILWKFLNIMAGKMIDLWSKRKMTKLVT